MDQADRMHFPTQTSLASFDQVCDRKGGAAISGGEEKKRINIFDLDFLSCCLHVALLFTFLFSFVGGGN